ncbi:ScpA family protein [Acidisphaera sp. L21]|uniref:segregation and condensation protein A n=1 Tax=Acidisphaera sp. L21 TaxID=1641851 RepID=UPI00131DF7FC|nr:ScpA family protein [Acidisphaera sp. L21]
MTPEPTPETLPESLPESLRLDVQLDGFEGPLDLLLELARAQKVDMTKISILRLVEQFLIAVDGARRVRLELAADWLVMAAWLTWLKSRLLLPDDVPEAEEGLEAAEVLAARLLALQRVRAAAAWLNDRPQLGRDVWARPYSENFTDIDRSGLAADTAGLLRGYLAAMRRGGGRRTYTPAALPLWSVQDALARLGAMIGRIPEWTVLEQFLPEATSDPLARRAATASTLLAGLELARDGRARIRQDTAFGPILFAGAMDGG